MPFSVSKMAAAMLPPPTATSGASDVKKEISNRSDGVASMVSTGTTTSTMTTATSFTRSSGSFSSDHDDSGSNASSKSGSSIMNSVRTEDAASIAAPTAPAPGSNTITGIVHRPPPREDGTKTAKLGLGFRQKLGYIEIARIGGLFAAAQTDLCVGLRVQEINGVPVETVSEAAALCYEATETVVVVAQGICVKAHKHHCRQRAGIRLKQDAHPAVASLAKSRPSCKADVIRLAEKAAAAYSTSKEDLPVRISHVNPNGMFPTLKVGQILLAINGQPITCLAQAVRLVSTCRNGTITVVVKDDVDEDNEDDDASSTMLDYELSALKSTSSVANEDSLRFQVSAQMVDEDDDEEDHFHQPTKPSTRKLQPPSGLQNQQYPKQETKEKTIPHTISMPSMALS